MRNKVFVYVRVSTDLQSSELQKREILEYVKFRKLEVYHIYEDKESGTKSSRPALNQMMKDIRRGKGHILIIWKLDRLFRSLKNLVVTLHELNELGIQFISLRDQIDFSTASGTLMAHMLGAFAEFEASLIRERVKAGIDNARAKGKTLGRPRKHFPKVQVIRLREEGLSFAKISKATGVSEGSIRRILKSRQKTLKIQE